jgi:two-component system chemotaxis sensor kinase CheA
LHGQGKGPSAITPAAHDTVEPVSHNQEQPVEAVTKAVVSAQPQAAQQAVQSETTVRVDTRTLDVIMNMVGELVLVRNRLISLGVASNDEDLAKAVSNLDVVTADLQGAVMKTRMQPIKKVFGRFPRVVRDLARSLKKEIEAEFRGNRRLKRLKIITKAQTVIDITK